MLQERSTLQCEDPSRAERAIDLHPTGDDAGIEWAEDPQAPD
jgi:hypothetical protein